MNSGLRHPPPNNLTLLLNATPGRWIEDALGSRFAHVESLVPKGYAAYARLFHPAMTQEDRRVRWATVAEWSGKVYHSLMAFEGISVPIAGHGSADRPWADEPRAGEMDPEDIVELSRLLSDFTGTPDQYYFAVWDGYGSFSVGGSALYTPSGGISLLPAVDVENAQRIKGVAREYILFSGPPSINDFFGFPGLDGPNIWWPEDRSWSVSTDIDLDSTYIGASEECIERLISHPSLEVLRTTSNAPVYMAADTINL
ncbi:MAG: hypothetical protein OXI16_06530 [Chloroflexota bacterium]|nr:hypothetical protein [Chloroflexota bacterium]MDE2687140.1 hypothetical protein [Chloroflexota bacterium]